MNPQEYVKMHELEDHYWWFVGRRRLALELVAKYVKRGTDLQILDLGCGTGVVSKDLQGFAESTGLDFSSQALDFCRGRGLGRLVHGDAEALPLKGDQFDAIISLDVFEHLRNDQAAFRESFRVLAPGGVLVLSVPAFRSLWGPHDVALHHFRRYRRKEVSDRLQAAGFQMVRNSYSVFLLFPLVVLTRVVEKARRGPARASLPHVPDWMNRFLIWLQKVEANMIVKLGDLPWGSSVVAVARKPDR